MPLTQRAELLECKSDSYRNYSRRDQYVKGTHAELKVE